jgi:hypothetical protein
MSETALIESPQEAVGRVMAIRPLEDWEIAKNKASMFALSFAMPMALKSTSEATIVNAMLILELAHLHQESPITIAQSLQIIQGKVGWDAKYIIAKMNKHGVFSSRVGFEVKGAGDSLSVTAFATLKETGERTSATCDMKMAKAEGWTKNSKYQSMPEQMLVYRSANFLARRHCPEIYVGLYTGDEIEDIAYSSIEGSTLSTSATAPVLSARDRIAAMKAQAAEESKVTATA